MAKEAIKTRATTKLEYPNRYNVIIYNDDYTPMEFVIKLLIEVLNKNLKTAKDITMEIHNNTSAVAGNYNFEIIAEKNPMKQLLLLEQMVILTIENFSVE